MKTKTQKDYFKIWQSIQPKKKKTRKELENEINVLWKYINNKDVDSIYKELKNN